MPRLGGLCRSVSLNVFLHSSTTTSISILNIEPLYLSGLITSPWRGVALEL
eukprot:SAG31_NODE_44377_length_263_cov_0.621951_1_plen_50_part_01